MKQWVNNPNQKQIHVKKEECNKNNTYTTINIYALQEAMKNLSNAEFKIWMYFAKNTNNYEFDLSPAEAAMNWGIKKNTMQETIRKFIELGYMVNIDGVGNRYYFFELPAEQ